MVAGTDAEALQISTSWIASLDNAFASNDVDAIVSLFLPDGWLRDLLTFTWSLRSLHGAPTISAYLAPTLSNARVRNLALERGRGILPSFVPGRPVPTVETAFAFHNAVGPCRGLANLVQNSEGEWKAHTVLMMLDDISGHEEDQGGGYTYEERTVTWGELRTREVEKIEQEPEVVILGAGHSGLQCAARFKRMGIRALVIEKNSRVGDNWRQRYPSLKLHTPRAHHQFLYASFPSTWPTWTPRDKLADWIESYSKLQDLVVWTNSQILPVPTYDPAVKRWTVQVVREGSERVLRPAHIVLATGTLGDPLVPTIPGQAAFPGPAIHSSSFPGGQAYAGQRVLIVGAGTTAADVAQDLVYRGASSVTILQRSSTTVVSIAYNTERLFKRRFPEDVPIGVLDLRSAATPLGLLKTILQAQQAEAREFDREMIEGLHRAGFATNDGPEGAGQYWGVLTSLGGFTVDVGCAALITDGLVKIKHGVDIAKLEEKRVVFGDGSEMEVDALIYATGYKNIRDCVREIFGSIIDKTSPVWGVDEEGELRGCYKPSGQEGLWFAAGDFFGPRFYSKQLALQIKSQLLGIN